MIGQKKTLIVVYKDELLMNQLKKLVETRDDKDDDIVGTTDNSISIVSWTEKVWLSNKEAGNIQGKILYLGECKGSEELKPVIDVKFDNYGVKFGWAGNQAMLYADVKRLKTKKEYDEFLEKLSECPVPAFLKPAKEEIITTGICSNENNENEEENADDKGPDTVPAETDKTGTKHQKIKAFKIAKGAAGAAKNAAAIAKDAALAGVETAEKIGNQVVVKSEEIFRNKALMKRQMLFYGVINLYYQKNGLEEFMNS